MEESTLQWQVNGSSEKSVYQAYLQGDKWLGNLATLSCPKGSH